MLRRLAGFVAAAALVAGGVAAGLHLSRSWAARVAVRGHSMEPTLRDGDWLLVDPAAHISHAGRALFPGDVVVARDPRATQRVIVKRVESVGAWPDPRVVLTSDNPAHAGERIEATFDDVTGGPWFRYWPPSRLGRVR